MLHNAEAVTAAWRATFVQRSPFPVQHVNNSINDTEYQLMRGEVPNWIDQLQADLRYLDLVLDQIGTNIGCFHVPTLEGGPAS